MKISHEYLVEPKGKFHFVLEVMYPEMMHDYKESGRKEIQQAAFQINKLAGNAIHSNGNPELLMDYASRIMKLYKEVIS